MKNHTIALLLLISEGLWILAVSAGRAIALEFQNNLVGVDKKASREEIKAEAFQQIEQIIETLDQIDINE